MVMQEILWRVKWSFPKFSVSYHHLNCLFWRTGNLSFVWELSDWRTLTIVLSVYWQMWENAVKILHYFSFSPLHLIETVNPYIYFYAHNSIENAQLNKPRNNESRRSAVLFTVAGPARFHGKWPTGRTGRVWRKIIIFNLKIYCVML